MRVHKQVVPLSITSLLLLIGFFLSLYTNQTELAFVTLLMFGISVLPHYFKSIHNVHVPSIFVYISIIFIFASLVLGQFNKFYEKFHWYDAFLHFISAVVFGIIGFLLMYVFYANNKLRMPRILVVLFAFSFSLMVGALWEIAEFATDRWFGTNLQVNSLEDTMVDIILDTLGALLASTVGYLYLRRTTIPGLEPVIEEITKEVVVENTAVAEDVIHQED